MLNENTEDSFRFAHSCPACDGSGEGRITDWWPSTAYEPSAPRACDPCSECDGSGEVSGVLGEPAETFFRTDEMADHEPDVSLADMLAANAEDEYVCDWLRNARPGDVLDEVIVVTCVR